MNITQVTQKQPKNMIYNFLFDFILFLHNQKVNDDTKNILMPWDNQNCEK